MKKTTSDKLAKFVELLTANEYQNGTSIGEKLDVTRTAVWKIIKKLQAYDIAIKSVKGKGYCLEEPLILLNKRKIKALLNNKMIQLDVVEKITSTTDHFNQIHKPLNTPIVCIAETQTKGRGRLGRTWHSPFGQNIYFSFLYPLQKDLSELSGLSLVAALATCNAIETTCDLQGLLSLKWPNDIMANSKKISGNLIDVQAESHGFCNVIISIGINVNMLHTDNQEITQAWTSIRELSQRYYDRNLLCAALINQLCEYLKLFEQHGLKYFIKEWQQRDYLVGKKINLLVNDKKITGTVDGINEQGYIILTLPSGVKKSFASGDAVLSKEAF